jgi:hypothetical protein
MSEKNEEKIKSLVAELEKRKTGYKSGKDKKIKRLLRKTIRRAIMGLAIFFLLVACVFVFNFFRLNSDLIEGHIKKGLLPSITRGLFDLEFGGISGNLLYGVEIDNIAVKNKFVDTSSTLLMIPNVKLEYSLLDILIGNLVLENIEVDNPILTLSRDSRGRGLWDFSPPRELRHLLEQDKAPKEENKKLSKWERQQEQQRMASKYLSNVNIKNVTILLPSPKKLITDDFIGRIFELPERTVQYSGIDLTLKKYPDAQFNAHVFKVNSLEKGNLFTLDITTLKKSGDFNILIDALGQNFNVGVENLGEAGRRVKVYDGKQRDRLDLTFTLARDGEGLFHKIQGMAGRASLTSFEKVFSDFITDNNELTGAFEVIFNSQQNAPLLEAKAKANLKDFSLKFAGAPRVENLQMALSVDERVATIRDISGVVEGISFVHNGYLEFKDPEQLILEVISTLAGERMATKAEYTKVVPGVHKFTSQVQRNSGNAKLSFLRKVSGKLIEYSDFALMAELISLGSAEDIIPFNLIPGELAQQLKSYCQRVQILGPFKITTDFATLKDWKKSKFYLDFNGTSIVNKQQPTDFVKLGGRAIVDAGNINLDGLNATLDNLVLRLSGFAKLLEEKPFVEDFELNILGELEDSKPFVITAERLQSAAGLAARPDFDHIDLRGNKILEVAIKPNTNARLRLAFDALNLTRRGKVLWIADTGLELETDPLAAEALYVPTEVTAQLKTDLFGVELEASVKAQIASKTFDSFSVKGGSKSFNQIIKALKTQPEGQEFFKKFPMDIGGSFTFSLLGRGDFVQPEAEGWVRFPALNFSMPELMAKLPFYAQINTLGDGYKASIKAGDASLKVKDVAFDLGASNADLTFTNLVATQGADIALKADTKVFGVTATAEGKLIKAATSIEKLMIKLTSSRIDLLASELARIGQFAIPFKLAGQFEALANLSGSVKEPSANGNVKIGNINLDFPIPGALRTVPLKAEGFSSQIKFNKVKNKLFTLSIDELSGQILGAKLLGKGEAELKDLDRGLKPVIKNLTFELDNLNLKRLNDYLKSGLLPTEIASAFSTQSGDFMGKFTLSGTPEKILAKGNATLKNGSILFPALKDQLEDLGIQLYFEGRTDSKYAKIGVKDFKAKLGRSYFTIPDGWVEDPLKSGKIMMLGQFNRVYPKDILKMLGGMQVPALSFPTEGFLSGSIQVDGTLAGPQVCSEVKSTAMTIGYDTGNGVVEVPLDENFVKLKVEPVTGKALLERLNLRVLGGSINVENGAGSFHPSAPFTIDVDGVLDGIDFSKLTLDKKEALKGLLGGTFKVLWDDKKGRDAIFSLDFKNIFVPELPLIEPSMKKSMGDLITPDLRTGQINFYVTSEEEKDFVGKLLVADGLFAGPHIRLEIDNSEFDPENLSLAAQLMINPQSLRQTEIGKKLGKITSVMQDRNTGIPFVDLTVAGKWSNPSLITSSIKKRTTKRATKNVFNKIFGRHRPHKASVEELMEWFPGWEKGK